MQRQNEKQKQAIRYSEDVFGKAFAAWLKKMPDNMETGLGFQYLAQGVRTGAIDIDTGRKHARSIEGKVDNYIQNDLVKLLDREIANPSSDIKLDKSLAEFFNIKDDVICLTEVTRLKVEWLIKGYIPRGMLTSSQGDPGGGKTMANAAITAGITRGILPPDANNHRQQIEPSNVLFINAEDSLEHTIAPRLFKANADMSKVFTLNVEQNPLHFGQVDRIESAVKRFKPILVVFDPIQEFLGSGIDMYRANEVRPIMSRIKDLAARHNFACIIVMHQNKYGGGKAQYRSLGSIDFAAIMRAQLLVGENRNIPGGRLIIPIKNSLGEKQPAQGFIIDNDGVHWTGPDLDATEQDVLMEASAKEGSALNESIEWLRKMLNKQPVWSTELDELAQADGISKRTLIRARQEMKDAWEIVNRKAPGLKRWYWSLNHKEVLFDGTGRIQYREE